VRSSGYRSFVLLVILFLAAVALFLAGILVQAQGVKPEERDGERMLRRVQLRGTVAQVLRSDCRPPRQSANRSDTRSRFCSSIDLIVLTKSGPRRILVGPTLFLRRKQFLFGPGDRLVVLGFQPPDSSGVLAEEIVRNKRAITLRSENGKPMWIRAVGTPQTNSIKTKVLTLKEENQNER
jgi:hypothetical protein